MEEIKNHRKIEKYSEVIAISTFCNLLETLLYSQNLYLSAVSQKITNRNKKTIPFGKMLYGEKWASTYMGD